MRAFVLLVLALCACAPSAAQAPIADQWRALNVDAAPVELGAESIGRLVFRGGLDLRSDDPAFGGLSGIEALDDNRVLAISDDGKWFEARLVLDEQGALTGLADVRTALMRDENGEVFASKAAGDSEDLAQLLDGRFAVSFEQTQSIRIYDLNRDGPFGAARAGPVLDHVSDLPPNVGLEALTATSDGALLVGAEGGGRGATRLWLAPLGAFAPVAPRIGYPLRPGYSLTSLDRLPDGGIVALERFYAPVIGARARISMFPEAAINGDGDEVDGVELLGSIAPPLAVDNFEGITATRMPDGATRIYTVSDNNFSGGQRTLLLAFDVVVENAPAAN